MKKLISLLILFVVLISLCSELPIQLPSLPIQTNGAATIDSSSPDIFVSVETPSSEIRSGRSLQLFFEIRNKQLYDLRKVNFSVYDYPCFDVTGNSFTKDNCGSGGTLKSNQSCMWSWRWTADSSDIDRTCSIKFKVSYEASNSIFQDIAVLSQAEYNQREASGTLGSIPIQFTSAKGPLSVYLTFSEPQPFIAGQGGYNMYINYNNVGDGLFVDETNDINLDLTAPNNMQGLSCDGYDPISGTNVLHLAKSLKFIKGRSVPTICDFNTPQISTLSIRSLNMEINYKYTLYGSFPITVRGSNFLGTTGGGTGGGSGGGGGSEGCLLKGSKILTPEGFRKIEDLKVGDLVIGYENGEMMPSRITKTSSLEGDWTLYYYKGTWFTGNHKVYPSLNDEAVPVPLVSNQTEKYRGYVYNIETETHNYFGENDLLIHNVPKP
jgi:hypothetical protein